MNYKLIKLASGLRLLTVPMESSESTTVTVWVPTGSRNEEKRVSGISHFLEHMVFKGSKKRPTAKEISEVVDSIGGEVNAGTSKDWTNFYIKARNAHIETVIDILSDMIINPILDEKEIEREKGTIVQEIAMYEDTPIMNIGSVFEELTFEGNPLGRDIAGTPETVKGIKKSDFESYRKRYYYLEDMLVTVAGGVNQETVLKLLEKHFSQAGKKESTTKTHQKDFIVKQSTPQVKIKNKKSDQAHFILGFMGDGRNYKKRFAQAVLSTILGEGMSSRLFIEVRERRGLAYAVKTGFERYQDVGYLSTYIGTDPKKVDEAISVTLSEYYNIASKKSPITQKELLKAKEYLKGHLALALEDTSAINSFFGEQALFLDEILTPEEIFKKIDKVTVDEVYEEARKIVDPKKLNLAIIGPYKNKSKFLKLLK